MPGPSARKPTGSSGLNIYASALEQAQRKAHAESKSRPAVKEAQPLANTERKCTANGLTKTQTLELRTTEYALSLKNALEAARDPMAATEEGLRQCKRMATKGRALEYVRGCDELERIRRIAKKERAPPKKKRDRFGDEQEQHNPQRRRTPTAR